MAICVAVTGTVVWCALFSEQEVLYGLPVYSGIIIVYVFEHVLVIYFHVGDQVIYNVLFCLYCSKIFHFAFVDT